MQVITRDTPANDIVFSNFDMDYQATMNDFQNRSIYLQAADTENFLTLTVTKTTTEESKLVNDYNDLSADELKRIEDTFLAIPSYQECEEKEINGYKYLCLLVNDQTNGNYIYSQQYNTVVHGDNYIVSLQAPNAQQLTNKDKTTLDRIMKSVEIREKTAFTEYGSTIILIVACAVAFVGVIALFIVLYKVVRDPKRKNKNLIHQLAHEHKITETAKIPRKKLHEYMVEPEPVQEDFAEKYEAPVEKLSPQEADTREYHSFVKESRNDSAYIQQREADVQEKYEDKNDYAADDYQVENNNYVANDHQEGNHNYDVDDSQYDNSDYAVGGQYEEEYEFDSQCENEESDEIFSHTTHISKNVRTEAAVVVEDVDAFGGTDYFDDVPADEDMYSYSDVEEAVEDYSNAKRKSMRYRNADENKENPVLKVLKKIGKGTLSVLQTIFVIICYVVVHFRYFCINLSRLIRRKRMEKKRRKIQEENKRRAEERRRRQREAEMRRQRENRNRGENDLVMVRSRNDGRNYQGRSGRSSSDRPRRY